MQFCKQDSDVQPPTHTQVVRRWPAIASISCFRDLRWSAVFRPTDTCWGAAIAERLSAGVVLIDWTSTISSFQHRLYSRSGSYMWSVCIGWTPVISSCLPVWTNTGTPWSIKRCHFILDLTTMFPGGFFFTILLPVETAMNARQRGCKIKNFTSNYVSTLPVKPRTT